MKKLRQSKGVETSPERPDFFIHGLRGGAPGFDLDDWLPAEREILAEQYLLWLRYEASAGNSTALKGESSRSKGGRGK